MILSFEKQTFNTTIFWTFELYVSMKLLVMPEVDTRREQNKKIWSSTGNVSQSGEVEIYGFLFSKLIRPFHTLCHSIRIDPLGFGLCWKNVSVRNYHWEQSNPGALEGYRVGECTIRFRTACIVCILALIPILSLCFKHICDWLYVLDPWVKTVNDNCY